MKVVAGFAAGLLFGGGLVLSRMTDPRVVLAFLDVTGTWNPTLLGVMGGAVATFGAFYWITIARRRQAVLAADLSVPAERPLDGRLFAGTALFGIGWGLTGLCPGPAITSLAAGRATGLTFAAAMIAGMALAAAVQRVERRAVSQSDRAT